MHATPKPIGHKPHSLGVWRVWPGSTRFGLHVACLLALMCLCAACLTPFYTATASSSAAWADGGVSRYIPAVVVGAVSSYGYLVGVCALTACVSLVLVFRVARSRAARALSMFLCMVTAIVLHPPIALWPSGQISYAFVTTPYYYVDEVCFGLLALEVMAALVLCLFCFYAAVALRKTGVRSQLAS